MHFTSWSRQRISPGGFHSFLWISFPPSLKYSHTNLPRYSFQNFTPQLLTHSAPALHSWRTNFFVYLRVPFQVAGRSRTISRFHVLRQLLCFNNGNASMFGSLHTTFVNCIHYTVVSPIMQLLQRLNVII